MLSFQDAALDNRGRGVEEEARAVIEELKNSAEPAAFIVNNKQRQQRQQMEMAKKTTGLSFCLKVLWFEDSNFRRCRASRSAKAELCDGGIRSVPQCLVFAGGRTVCLCAAFNSSAVTRCRSARIHGILEAHQSCLGGSTGWWLSRSTRMSTRSLRRPSRSSDLLIDYRSLITEYRFILLLTDCFVTLIPPPCFSLLPYFFCFCISDRIWKT